jgi:hypothetical protein
VASGCECGDEVLVHLPHWTVFSFHSVSRKSWQRSSTLMMMASFKVIEHLCCDIQTLA